MQFFFLCNYKYCETKTIYVVRFIQSLKITLMVLNNFSLQDLKPSNLLISFDGILKIADFSLSCTFSEELEEKPQIFSHKVASRWYRAPELLLGSHTYRTEVDLWSIGCIFVEMVNGAPLFPVKMILWTSWSLLYISTIYQC